MVIINYKTSSSVQANTGLFHYTFQQPFMSPVPLCALHLIGWGVWILWGLFKTRQKLSRVQQIHSFQVVLDKSLILGEIKKTLSGDIWLNFHGQCIGSGSNCLVDICHSVQPNVIAHSTNTQYTEVADRGKQMPNNKCLPLGHMNS